MTRTLRSVGLAIGLAALVACGCGAPVVTPTRPSSEAAAPERSVEATPSPPQRPVTVVPGDQPAAVIRPEQLRAVATAAERSAVEVRADATAQPGVVGGAGIAVVGAPPARATVEVRAEDGSAMAAPIVVDELRGVAAVDVGSAAPTALPRGSSEGLRPGDQAIFSGGAAPVVGTYVGQAVVPAGSTGLGRIVLEFSLPPGARVEAGAALDGQGRLLGILSSDRQVAPPAGHVFVVPVEQLDDVIGRAAGR